MNKKVFICSLSLFGVAFLGGVFFLGKPVFKGIRSHFAKHSDYKPMPKTLIMEKKPFVVVVSACNTEEFVEKNMRSVLEQNYENFRIVFIDNGSTDKTFQKANEWVRKYKKMADTKFIRNAKKRPQTEYLYYAIGEMDSAEVVVLLEGKDWFSHADVLSELNRYYNDPHVWLTYAQYSNFPEYERGEARSPIINAKKQIGIRSSPWIYSHYCSFYAGLFKRIKMRDLLYQGSFFQSKSSRAIMMPMLEMCDDHAVFIPTILYVNNREQKKLLFVEEEAKNGRAYSRYIRSLKPYAKLRHHPKYEVAMQQEIDLFIFSQDRPMQLYSFLESQKKYAAEINDVYVVYSASEERFTEGYALVQRQFPEVCFLKQDMAVASLKKGVISLINKASSGYVAIAEDQLLLKDQLDIGTAIALLEKTGAYGFYFSLGLNLQNSPESYYRLEKECVAWQFGQAEKCWNQSHSLGMTLYRKDDLADTLARLNFHSIDAFKEAFTEKSNSAELGICFRESKSVFNSFEIFRAKVGEKQVAYTPKELNELFLEGLKLDIRQIHRLFNKETSVSRVPHFIPR